MDVLGWLQDLEAALNQAAHPYSTTATGKLHYYLMEGEGLNLSGSNSRICASKQGLLLVNLWRDAPVALSASSRPGPGGSLLRQQ